MQVEIGNKKLRIFNCYGPQESGQSQRPVSEQSIAINIFWQELEKEVIEAYSDGCMIVIEMDANAKIGWKFLKNDPNDTSDNGKLLLELVDRQSLKILNCSKKCEGTISRQRITVERIEQSVIDYAITCEEMSAFFILSGKLLFSTSLLKSSVRGKQNKSALYFNIFAGIAFCGEPFLGSKFCSCSSISSTLIFLNEKFIVLLTDDFILRTLGCD